MDSTWSSNCGEIHHHLARAIMHLNTVAGFLPFFEHIAECNHIPSQVHIPFILAAISISLCLSRHHRHIQLLRHMGAFQPIWLWIRSPICVHRRSGHPKVVTLRILPGQDPDGENPSTRQTYHFSRRQWVSPLNRDWKILHPIPKLDPRKNNGLMSLYPKLTLQQLPLRASRQGVVIQLMLQQRMNLTPDIAVVHPTPDQDRHLLRWPILQRRLRAVHAPHHLRTSRWRAGPGLHYGSYSSTTIYH